MLLQDAHGQILPSHSVSAGLDYPGVGPEHAHLHAFGRVEYGVVNDSRALAAKTEEAGVAGCIVPDLPLEEDAPLRDALEARGMALLPLGRINFEFSHRCRTKKGVSKGSHSLWPPEAIYLLGNLKIDLLYILWWQPRSLVLRRADWVIRYAVWQPWNRSMSGLDRGVLL